MKGKITITQIWCPHYLISWEIPIRLIRPYYFRLGYRSAPGLIHASVWSNFGSAWCHLYRSLGWFHLLQCLDLIVFCYSLLCCFLLKSMTVISWRRDYLHQRPQTCSTCVTPSLILPHQSCAPRNWRPMVCTFLSDWHQRWAALYSTSVTISSSLP